MKKYKNGCTCNFFFSILTCAVVAILFACGFVPIITTAIWILFGLGILTLIFS